MMINPPGPRIGVAFPTAGQKFIGQDILLARARAMGCRILLNKLDGHLAILLRGELFEFENRKRISRFLGWAKRWKAATPTQLPWWVSRVPIPIVTDKKPIRRNLSLRERAAMDRGPIYASFGVFGGQSVVPGHYVELGWYDLRKRGT
jgi:hypothetical protein